MLWKDPLDYHSPTTIAFFHPRLVEPLIGEISVWIETIKTGYACTNQVSPCYVTKSSRWQFVVYKLCTAYTLCSTETVVHAPVFWPFASYMEGLCQTTPALASMHANLMVFLSQLFILYFSKEILIMKHFYNVYTNKIIPTNHHAFGVEIHTFAALHASTHAYQSILLQLSKHYNKNGWQLCNIDNVL